ncbi:MAG: AAA family ATPase, partial [Bacteroidales bacterium]|nr:AAA family ATPase [Bacteroidales bacterium]
MLNKQNLFEETFSLHRETTDEIYKGFGFRHFSDVTDYYISPQNESEYGTTVLSQPVGEAVVLGYEFLKSFFDNKPIGKLYYNEQKQRYFAEIFIPQDWRDNNVFPQEIFCYRAHIVVDEIKISAYNKYDEYITFDHSSSLLSRYKICMFFFIVLMRSFFENDKIKNDIIEFIRNYTKENFVVLCEDFYQHNKNLCVNSKDYWGGGLKDFKTVGYEKFSITCIPEMQQALQPVIISCFDDNEFSAEQLNLIPLLGSEFVLEDNLEKLCNAITFGDVRTVLFHGPAGTGKTISCKLICKTIRLPILETVNCTENLDEFILGKFIPENGKIVFKESYVTKAIREGGAVVFEEINFAKPQYLAFLNSLLDDNGFVRLDNGE